MNPSAVINVACVCIHGYSCASFKLFNIYTVMHSKSVFCYNVNLFCHAKAKKLSLKHGWLSSHFIIQ